MSFRKLLLAGAALAASTAAVATPANASIIDRPHFKVLGVVIVWAADETNGNTPIATDFVIDDSVGGVAANDTDLIGGAAVDGRTVVTGSLTPTKDSTSTAALGDILTIDDDGNAANGVTQSVDTGTPTSFGAFDVTGESLTGDLTHNSSFFVASNTAFNIDGTATALTQTGDFDMTDVSFSMGVTVSGTAATDGIDFGGNAQDPGGTFGSFANLGAMTGGTPVYQGNQRTAASAGTITGQSVRFDATYELGTSGYDLSMGAGEVEAEVVYTVYVP